MAVPILVAGLLGPSQAESANTRSRGVAMEGTDEALIQLPVAGWFEAYRNHGYELRVEQGRARVRSTLEPLVSRDPFALPALAAGSEAPLPRLARSLAAGSTTRHEAVSRILGWVATNVRYELLRGRSQEPEEVLARRSGYCTGVARLTTGLLAAIGIPAREVPGYVVSSRDGAPGYHRWIEVLYEDRGWVFSDPLVSHHYVPATYVPLASESLLPDAATETGVLLWRADHRRIVDRTPLAPAGVSVRRNQPRQRAGTLEIELPGVVTARAELRGRGSVRSQTLTLGRGVFLDLEPGTYVLSVEIPDRETVVKRVVFRGPVVGTVTIPPAG
ncbi:MAG TPA: transglutaminase-like domain-containing protein [Thermoanaerobaculia bacterium]|nr:transglutaminase-like domain-containing protein [Thermoanaerobaculia bacterium]